MKRCRAIRVRSIVARWCLPLGCRNRRRGTRFAGFALQRRRATPRLIWPEGESIRVRGEITPSALRVQIDDRRDWFGLTGSISLDGREVQLPNCWLRFVTIDRWSEWVTASSRKSARHFAGDCSSWAIRLSRAGRVEGGRCCGAGGTRVDRRPTFRWRRPLGGTSRSSDWNHWPIGLRKSPQDLDATLRDYQLEGYQLAGAVEPVGRGRRAGRRHGAWERRSRRWACWSIEPRAVRPWSSRRPALVIIGFGKPKRFAPAPDAPTCIVIRTATS